MEAELNRLIDAYDEAHDQRKQLAHRFMRVAPTKRTQKMMDELDAAMEAEEAARLAWVNHENKMAMGGE